MQKLIDESKTIHKVYTIKFVDFHTPSPLLYAFEQLSDVIKTIKVRFCLDPSLTLRVYVLYG